VIDGAYRLGTPRFRQTPERGVFAKDSVEKQQLRKLSRLAL